MEGGCQLQSICKGVGVVTKPTGLRGTGGSGLERIPERKFHTELSKLSMLIMSWSECDSRCTVTNNLAAFQCSPPLYNYHKQDSNDLGRFDGIEALFIQVSLPLWKICVSLPSLISYTICHICLYQSS
jgi:hypothetical protein